MINDQTTKNLQIIINHSDKLLNKKDAKSTKEKETIKFPVNIHKYKEFKDSPKFKDPNFMPFRLTNPRISRSKSPPLTQKPKTPQKITIHELKPKISNRDFLNYKTTTDFFSKLYLENKKLSKTFTDKFDNFEESSNKDPLKNNVPLVSPAWNIKKVIRLDSQANVELYSEKILDKIKKISLISSILDENCYEIIDLRLYFSGFVYIILKKIL